MPPSPLAKNQEVDQNEKKKKRKEKGKGGDKICYKDDPKT